MAYALETLIQIIEQNQLHLEVHNETQIQSLLRKAHDLRGLVEKSYMGETATFDSQIRDAAHMAEDIIESHITDQALSVFLNEPFQLDLSPVIKKFDFVTEEMLKIVKGRCGGQIDQHLSNLSSSPEPDTGSSDIVIGFDNVYHQMLNHVMECLNTENSPVIISITGMGGIGKTTLVRKLYNCNAIENHFDCRAWVTISEEINVRVTFLALLNCLIKITYEMPRWTEHQLGLLIRKTLYSRRYLIVVDDIWDMKAWDKIKWAFPYARGSRIILTTRQRTIAEKASSSRNLYQLAPIDDDASWSLLSLKVFGQDSCPSELVETGRKIARKCGGHPLAVLMTAGILSTTEKTLQFWEEVEKNVSSMVTQPDLSCFEILSVSYNHLPYYLKPCFLYVGAFPDNYEIQVSKIIQLWIAEGFVKPDRDGNFEDIAKAYLNALIDANLVMICRTEPAGNKVKTFRIHHLLREFCRKKAKIENFLWFKNFDDYDIEQGESLMRRVSAHPLFRPRYDIELMPPIRSFLCIGPASLNQAPFFLGFRLLRVLDVFQLEFSKFPLEILQLVNLKYLALSCHSNLSSLICRFRNLHTLIIRRLPTFRVFTLPSELWEISQLKHIKSKGSFTWYFPKTGKSVINSKLLTLSNIHISGAINDLFEKIPNLIKLGIFCDASLNTDIDLACLCKLEILKCSSYPLMATSNFLSRLAFPDSLKKLTLSLCKIPYGFMTTIGSLPKLEQLTLHKNDFLVVESTETESEPEQVEPIWEPTEGGFSQLRYLAMKELNLVHWEANYAHFPILQHLVIRACCSMKAISYDIGEIETLTRIEVDDCSPSLLASVMEIHRQQMEFGDTLRVTVHNTH